MNERTNRRTFFAVAGAMLARSHESVRAQADPTSPKSKATASTANKTVTEYLVAVTQKAITAQAAEPLARTLDAFARMYEEHAALEDKIVFPAWKKLLTPKDLEEMGERFEEIERKTFGKDGFDDAVDQVCAIEKSLGIGLAALTAPPVKP